MDAQLTSFDLQDLLNRFEVAGREVGPIVPILKHGNTVAIIVAFHQTDA
jgi:hypothetical protein